MSVAAIVPRGFSFPHEIHMAGILATMSLVTRLLDAAASG
jgi:hypothetical protein